jgi:hypothetical protein
MESDMEIVRSLLILATFLQVASADANDTGYRLPPNKEHIKPCQGEALRLHPGGIDEQRMLHSQGDFWVRLDIQAYDGSEWLVLCDLATGKIIREQKLIDDAL